jgi:CubicO group peptidase (beta-lactamase class C family)
MRVATLALIPLLALAGCESPPAPGDITEGVWVGDGGPDQFLFDLRGASPDSLVGAVHVMRNGKMDSELAITRAFYRPPDIEMFIESTKATYRGRVDLSRGRITGSLSFAGEPGPEMGLTWADPSGMPGFRALAGGGRYVYREPGAGDGWEVSAPEEVGLDRGSLEALVDAVARDEAGLLHSLLVVRSGKLVLEEYFHGYAPADLHRLASTTKSVSSLLVAAALDRGSIPGLDAPLLRYFPEDAANAGPGWEDETLQDLMSMSMGLDWTPEEEESVHGTGRAFFRQVLARRVVDPPGTKWSYVNANVNLLAGVLFQATGRQADAWAAEVLFAPLGIGTWDWDYGKDGGYVLMDGSLQLRPRDLAKIGAMVAAGGRWDGDQVVGRKWIHELTKLHFRTGQPLSGYGDLWWLGELPTEHGTQPMIVANGWGSQFIVIFPRLDMVVVTTGGNDDNGRHPDIGMVLSRTLISPMQGGGGAP